MSTEVTQVIIEHCLNGEHKDMERRVIRPGVYTEWQVSR